MPAVLRGTLRAVALARRLHKVSRPSMFVWGVGAVTVRVTGDTSGPPDRVTLAVSPAEGCAPTNATAPIACPRRTASSVGFKEFILYSRKPQAWKKRYPAAAAPKVPPAGDT